MRNRTLISFGFLVLAAVARPGLAEAAAEPLTLYQLDSLAEHLRCMAECGSDPTCQQACPSWSTKWDKDLSGLVGTEDMDLGLMEYWDDLRERYVCYQQSETRVDPSTCLNDCVVTPHSLCGAAACIADKSEAECKDVDGDGLRAWQEEDLDTSDYDHNADCSGTEQVCTFTQKCETEINAAGLTNASLCTSRDDCLESGCTAFHLEQVSVNNNELIIRVWYDYSPEPARILQLYINYDDNALHLVDARPLKLLTNAGKQLSTNHVQDDVLRLVVLDTGSNTAIQTGAIIELVFDRISSSQSTVEFTEEDHLQEMSMAPDQGTDGNGEIIREQLGDDSLWGEDIEVPAADPNGPRLLLYYSFDNPNDYLNYADVKNGAELCAQSKECSVLDTGIPVQKEEREKLTTRLGNLQKGAESITETIDAVIGPGAYLNGKTDHLEFPVTMNDPTPSSDGTLYYDRAPQGFSLSTWFYAEADDSLDLTNEGQVLFSRNTNDERTRFGVLIQRAGMSADCTSDGVDDDDDNAVDEPGEEGFMVRLVWFQDELYKSDGDAMHQVDIAEICARNWTHLGVVLHDTLPEVDDDGDGLVDDEDIDEYDRVSFYIDGVLQEFDLDDGTEDVNAVPFRGVGGYNYGDGYEMECPYVEPAGGLTVHEEGENIELTANPGSPEVLFFASAENNLFGIEQMDLNGFARKEIIRTGDSSAKYPDYYPLLDKIVYSSSESGNYEIWIANGDGSNPRQITKGFGDTARKIFALRPKWAPDGSGIVFESNIYSLEYMHNWFRRVYHLYYIGYDYENNEVAIESQGGQTLTELVYDDLVGSGTIDDHRLTDNNSLNHFGAVWKRGASTVSDRGQLWYNTADIRYEGRKIQNLVIPYNAAPQSDSPVSINDCFGDVTADEGEENKNECIPDTPDYSMFDAYYIHPAGMGPQSEMLFTKEWSTYEDKTDVEHFPYVDVITPSYTTNQQGQTVPFKYEVTIKYAPQESDFPDVNGYECWDLNLNGEPDLGSEDRNGDGACNWKDCVEFELPNLYLEYNAEAVSAKIDESTSGADITKQDTDEGGFAKDVQIGDNFTSCGQFVKIRVLSPVNNLPIGAGESVEVATIVFEVLDIEDVKSPDFVLKKRTVHQKLGVVDLIGGHVGELKLANDALEFVLGGAFSPDGNRIVLSGIQQARPVVLVSRREKGNELNILNTITNTYELNEAGCRIPADKPKGMTFDKISTMPMKVEGLDWIPIERYYPCSWVGGHLDRESKMFEHAFRGGLDELKLYSYAREAGAFQSDAERGEAWLEKMGRDGQLENTEETCTTNFECPAYKLCHEGTCEITPCDPETPCGQGDGVCTLMPVPVGLGEDGLSEELELNWVCSVECESDRECFKQECLNGPCRFCDIDTWSCLECEWRDHQISGEITLTYIDGCPDRKSFDCVDGSCVTECYQMQNGESVYLCDPALEYCDQGRCKIFDWAWSDFAPGSFLGLGETVYNLEDLDITMAIPQVYPVVIEAFGSEDYLNPPELMVEGLAVSGKDPYEGAWFRIGSITVHNKKREDAKLNPYTLYTPFPVQQIRMRLVNPPFHNLTNAATGYDSQRNKALCDSSDCLTCKRWEVRSDDGCMRSVCLDRADEGDEGCIRRAGGSRATHGYPIGLPWMHRRWACAKRGGLSDCNYNSGDPAEPYLYGGQPTAIILDVIVNNKNVRQGVIHNKICPYLDEPNYSPTDQEIQVSATPQYYKTRANPKNKMLMNSMVIYGDVARELSNQKTEFYRLANKAVLNGNINTAISTINITDGSGVGDDWFVLNCNLFGDDLPNQADVSFTVCAGKMMCDTLFPTTNQEIDSVIEYKGGNCIVKNGMRSSPCYEWTGADVSMDHMSYMEGSAEPWHTLDFDYYRSFGWDE